LGQRAVCCAEVYKVFTTEKEQEKLLVHEDKEEPKRGRSLWKCRQEKRGLKEA